MLKHDKKKSLLIIIKGIPKGEGINRKHFYRYKVMIKERYKAKVIKPYTLLFDKEINKENKEKINSLLLGIAEYV
jgi:hypothetical protein